MSSIWDQAPGVYAPKAATAALLVGPHNRLERNGIVFNDRSQRECFWVDDFTGFDFADPRAAEQENVQETGSLPDPANFGGRTMTMTGWVQAGTYPTMLNMGRALLDSLVDLVEKPLKIVTAETGYFTQPDVEIACRVADKPSLATQIQQSDMSGVIKRNFTVALRATDPVYRGTTEKHAILTPQVVAIPGRPYDRVYDLTYTELLDLTGSISSGGPNVLTITNAGNWDASVRLRATGAMTSVTVVNESTGQAMYFANIAAGDYLEVDTHPRRGNVYDSFGFLRNNLLDSRSDWITLRGVRGGTDGSNRIVLYVETYDPGAKLEVWWNDSFI